MMATFIDYAIYNFLNTDGVAANDVDLFLNNAGGIRTDWCDKPDPRLTRRSSSGARTLWTARMGCGRTTPRC